MRRLICVYVVRMWQNDNRSFRTQVISYPSHFVLFWLFVPIFIFNLVILYPVWSLPVLVSYLHILESESFRPLSRLPLSRFAHFPFRAESIHPRILFVFFSVRRCVVSPTFPFASRVDSSTYKFCFGLLIGVKLVLFEILSYKLWAMNSVSDVYIHFQSWHL